MTTLTLPTGTVAIEDFDANNAGFFDKTDLRDGWRPAAGNQLWFPSNGSTTLTIDNKSLTIKDTNVLKAHPDGPTRNHVIRWLNIDESKFAGAKARAVAGVVIGAGGSITYDLLLPSGWTSHNYTTDDWIIVTGFTGAAVGNNTPTTGSPPTPVGAKVTAIGPPNTPAGHQTVTCVLAAPVATTQGTGLVKAHDHQPTKNDPGLWVLGGGIRDLVGSVRSPRNCLAAASVSGTGTVTIDLLDWVTGLPVSPTGWQNGDELILSPTDHSWDHFDLVTIASISGNHVVANVSGAGTIAAGRHSLITFADGSTIGCEVSNNTFNVRLEGQDATHRAHTMTHLHAGATPILNSDFQLRFMGPRHSRGPGGGTDVVTGRWGEHVHRAKANSIGSIFLRAGYRDCGSHAMVAHDSYGVTWDDFVAFDNFEAAAWWDADSVNDASDDIIYKNGSIGRVRFDPPDRNRGFGLVLGEMLTPRSCKVIDVAVWGVNAGTGRDSSGMGWPEGGGAGIPQGTSISVSKEWEIIRPRCHNNRGAGLLSWINGAGRHEIVDARTYCDGEQGIGIGAYLGTLQYRGHRSYDDGWNDANGNTIILHTSSRISPLGGPTTIGGGSSDRVGRSVPDIRVVTAPLIGTARGMIPARHTKNQVGAVLEVEEFGGSSHQLGATGWRLERVPGTITDVEFADCLFDGVVAPHYDFKQNAQDTGFELINQRLDNGSCWRAYAAPRVPPDVPTAVPFTGAASSDVLTAAAHGFKNGEQVVVFDTGAEVLPGGLVEGTDYLVRDAAVNTFKLTATSGGAAINLTTDGNGSVGYPSFAGDIQVEELADPVFFYVTTLELHINIGEAFSEQIGTALGANPVTFRMLEGTTFPAGVSMSTGGLVTYAGGATDAAGTYPVVVEARDANQITYRAEIDVIVASTAPAPLTITSPGTIHTVVGAAFSYQLVATGGSGGNVWTKLSGNLPTGVSLSAGGLLSPGPSTVEGSKKFTARVADNTTGVATKLIDIITDPALVVLTTVLPTGTTGQPYFGHLVSQNGTGPMTWAFEPGFGSMPSGIALGGSTGDFTGPMTATDGDYAFRVKVTDSLGAVAYGDVHIPVVSPIVFVFTELDDALQWTDYEFELLVVGGIAPYHFELVAEGGGGSGGEFGGELPLGIELVDADDRLSGFLRGNPEVGGPFPVTIRVTGALGNVADLPATLFVAPRDFTGRSYRVAFDEHLVRVRMGRAG